MANSDFNYEDLVYLGKSYFANNLTRNWSYNYHLQLKSPNIENKITFYDGEVEQIFWHSESEIIGLIKKDAKITEDSVDIFINFINKKHQI